MDPRRKIVLAHKGFFDAASEKKYPENSKEVCAISNKKDYINIIELDVRKSRDGILYCYHGSLWEYYAFLKMPKDFEKIKKKLGADSLESILDVISEDKSIFLDIKDTFISREDVLKVFEKKNLKKLCWGISPFLIWSGSQKCRKIL